MHWFNEIALWCELLLDRRMDFSGMHQNFYDGCFVVTLCAALEIKPSDGDIGMLGVLIERSLAWDGPRDVLYMECTGRSRIPKRVRFTRETDEIYSFRYSDRLRWCVRVSTVNRFFSARSYPQRGKVARFFVDLFMFSPLNPSHMDLFIAVERQNQDSDSHIALFRPLLAVLRRSESFVVPFNGNEALRRVLNPSTWLDLVRTVWPDAEQIEPDDPALTLSDDQNGSVLSILTRTGFFNTADYAPHPPIVIANSRSGIFITISQHSPAGGCVLMVAGIRT